MLAILRSHRLADFVLGAVLLLGAWAYFAMPRAQYPEVNLNWVAVAVIWPGAAAQDVEREITLPLEAAARRVADVRLVTATSRDNVATLLVRFADLPHGRFERRLAALDREIRQAAAAFPREARPPQVLELTSSNFFPTAMVAVSGEASDGRVCRLAELARDELERLPGVARVWAYGLRERELAVDFDPDALRQRQVSPETLARAVADQAHTYPAGMADVSGRRYAIRVEGLSANPDFLAELPVADAAGKPVPLGELARVRQGVGPARELARLDGKPAVLLSVIKAENVNTLELTRAVRELVARKNQAFGAPVYTLLDDQSDSTREAIGVMQANALFGLAVVLLVTWFFLGGRMALLTSVGVPFALAGMFLALYLMGQTLNVSVLLGVAIVLGIPLDDAVVVADAIRIRLAAGMNRLDAVAGALGEVARPVTASVFATCLAFAPLLLLPGLLGRFMFVTPLTVIVTLGMSLIASLWLLPRHASAWGGTLRQGDSHPRASAAPEAETGAASPPLEKGGRGDLLAPAGNGAYGNPPQPPFGKGGSPSAALWHGNEKTCCWRERLARRLRRRYGRALAVAFRHPLPWFALFGGIFLVAGLALGLEWVKPRWFASDPLRVFNLNLQMPPTTGMEATLRAARTLEQAARGVARPGEVKASLAMAGLQFTPSEMVLGEHLGQVTVSLAPESAGARPVAEFVAALRPALKAPGAENIAVQVLSADLPMLSSLTLRLSGAPLAELSGAARDLGQELAKTPGFTDVRNDAGFSQPRIVLRVDPAAAARAGFDPFKLAALIRLHFEGVPVGKVAEGEETLNVVVRGKPLDEAGVRRLLGEPWRLPDGRLVNPGELFSLQFESTPGELRRVDGRRAVSLHASFDQDRVTAHQALASVDAAWAGLAARHPGVSLAQGGEMEDVKASLNDLLLYLLLGFVLMYAWLAVQFGRLALPLVILATAPMALAGVAIGLLASGQPITLYTLYGCVALTGVAVNASIVLVSAGEDRLALGMNPLAAAFHAARRRLVPIIITTLTVIGGLISLAFGWGGNSLLWGPLASAIVWGLVVATPLTLFVTPLMHAWLMRRRLGSEERRN